MRNNSHSFIDHIKIILNFILSKKLIRVYVLIHCAFYLFAPNGLIFGVVKNLTQKTILNTEIQRKKFEIKIAKNTYRAMKNKTRDIQNEMNNRFFYLDKDIYVLENYNTLIEKNNDKK